MALAEQSAASGNDVTNQLWSRDRQAAVLQILSIVMATAHQPRIVLASGSHVLNVQQFFVA